MVVADASVSAIADVVFGEEVLFIEIPAGAIGGGVLTRSPKSRQREVVIGVDDGRDGFVERIYRDVPLVDPGDLPPVRSLHGSRRLAWTEIAAVAEGGEHIAFRRIFQLGVQPRQRAEEPRPVQQIFGIGKSIEDRRLRHLFSDRRFEPSESGWRLLARNLGEDWLSMLDTDRIVFRKGAVRLLRDLAEPSASFGNELLCIGRYAGLVLVG